MAFETFFEITVAGIGLGALYSLVAIGFVIIYKITGVLNFAQGQIALVGAYAVVFFVAMAGLHPYLAIIAMILSGIALGVILERGVFRHFVGESVLSLIIVTLGLLGILNGVVRLLPHAGPSYRAYPSELQLDWGLSIPVLRVSITGTFFVAILLSVLVTISLVAFFRYTIVGTALRAGASDQQAAMVLGISIERNILIAWVLSCVITMVGGMLFAMSRGGAAMSIDWVGIVIFTAVILGGLDSVPGAFIGSLVVGLLEQYGGFYLDPILGEGFGQILPLLFLVAVVVIMPYGLFGTEEIERI